MDRLPLQMSDLYVDVTPDRFSLIPEDVGFGVFDFDVSCGDAHRSHTQLLIPFDSLEAQSGALMPAQQVVPADPAAGTW